MIELRFVKRQVPNTHDEGGNVETVRIERVLQFRRENRFSTDEGYVTMWSPWADVPVVDESPSGEG